MGNYESCPNHSGIEAEIKNILTLLEQKENRVAGEIKKLCLLIDERQKQSDLRFNSNRDAIAIAKEDMERRLESMNEFRAQLSEQAKTFIARPEMKLEIERIINRILMLEKSTNYREGSKHWSDYIITSIVALAVFLFAHYVLKF